LWIMVILFEQDVFTFMVRVTNDNKLFQIIMHKKKYMDIKSIHTRIIR